MTRFELGDKVKYTRPLTRYTHSTVENEFGHKVLRRDWLFGHHPEWAGAPGMKPGVADGVIVGARTLANGKLVPASWDDQSFLEADEYFLAYLVAFDLRCKPVLVRAEHVELAEPQPRRSGPLRRVYRAVAKYGEEEVTRHFLTKRSRDAWAKQRREGYPERAGVYLGGGEYDDVAAIPPADLVEVAESEPVVFA